MQFIHSVLAQDEAQAADGTVTYDLPIHPMTHLWLTLKLLNNGVNTKATLANILAMITKAEILYKGQAIQSASLADLYALACIMLGNEPWMENVINTDNAVRAISVPMLMSRFPFWPDEAFPATKKGELKLQLTTDVAVTGADGLALQIETVELPEAQPRQYMKFTSMSKTPTATGEHDVDLPIGNVLSGIMLWGTTIPSGITDTESINTAKLLVDNAERYYSKTNWETMHNQFMRRLSPVASFGEKFHLENSATAYTQNADTATEEQDDSTLSNYAYLDIDVFGDGLYALDTAGKSRVHLRLDAGVADAIRVLPVEIVRL